MFWDGFCVRVGRRVASAIGIEIRSYNNRSAGGHYSIRPMSFRELPSYQRPTISSVSQSLTPAKKSQGNVTPAKKTQGNSTPGRRTPGNVPLAKVLSPMMSPSRARGQDKEAQKLHDNPLFGGNQSDAGSRSSGRPSSSLKTGKSSKGNGSTEETGRIRVQGGGTKQGSMTPGSAPRVPTTQLGTPPKSVLKLVKRRILSESAENISKPSGSGSGSGSGLSHLKRREESRIAPAFTSSEASVRKWGDETVPACDFEMKSPEPSVSQVSAVESKAFRRSSVEDLQKRIQKFLDTRVPVETLLFSPMVSNPCSSEDFLLSEEMNDGIPEASSQEEGFPSCQLVVFPDSPHSPVHRTTGSIDSLAVADEVENADVTDNSTPSRSHAVAVDVESVDVLVSSTQSPFQAVTVEVENTDHMENSSTQSPSQAAALEVDSMHVLDNPTQSPPQAAPVEGQSIHVLDYSTQQQSPFQAAAVHVEKMDDILNSTQSPSQAAVVGVDGMHIRDYPTQSPSQATSVEAQSMHVLDCSTQQSPSQAAAVAVKSADVMDISISTQSPSEAAALEADSMKVVDNWTAVPSQVAAAAEVQSMDVVDNLTVSSCPAAAVEIGSDDVVDSLMQSPPPAEEEEVERVDGRTDRPPSPVIDDSKRLETMEIEEEKAIIDDRPPTPAVMDKSAILEVREEETEESVPQDLPSCRIVEKPTRASGSDEASDSLTAENCWIDGSGAQTATSSSRSPDNGCSSLSGEHAANITSASECAKQLSRLHISSKEIHGKIETHRSAVRTPAKSCKPLADKNIYLTPQTKILEDSSLGRFTTIVPIVLKKGTEKEEVKLTPVRRSARIRRRYQAHSNQTPSRLLYSP